MLDHEIFNTQTVLEFEDPLNKFIIRAVKKCCNKSNEADHTHYPDLIFIHINTD